MSAPQQSSAPAARQSLTPLVGLEGTGGADGTARIGQPLAWRVESGGAAIARAPKGVGLDAGWVVIDGPCEASPGGALEWTLLSLDAGTRATPALELALVDGSLVSAPPTSIEVAGELAEGEDAPRPAAGFRDVVDAQVVQPGTLVLGLGVLFALVAAAIVLRRRRGHAPTAPTGPGAGARVAALGDPGNTAEALALAASLGPLARALVDEAAAAPRTALTDDEWLARVRADDGLDPALAAELEVLLERSAEARFGGLAPTVLGARELLTGLRDAARRLGPAPDADAPSAPAAPDAPREVPR